MDVNEKDELLRDEELEAETATHITEPGTAEEEADTIEEEIAIGTQETEEMIANEKEPEISPEFSETRVTFEIETSADEDAESLEAAGESFIDLAEEAEADELATMEDISHDEARRELGIEERSDFEEETPLSDALIGTEFISSPAEGDDNTIKVEEYDEENSPFDYDASSYDELGDDEDGVQTASGEKWWL